MYIIISQKLFWLKLPSLLLKLAAPLQYPRGPPRGRGPPVEDHCSKVQKHTKSTISATALELSL